MDKEQIRSQITDTTGRLVMSGKKLTGSMKEYTRFRFIEPFQCGSNEVNQFKETLKAKFPGSFIDWLGVDIPNRHILH
jgi:hypothetical protein